MSEISQLAEEINPDLLSQSETFVVQVFDGVSQQKKLEYHVEVPLNNPFSLDLSSFVPNEEVFTLEKFVDIASQVIDDAQAREGIVNSERIKLVQEHHGEDFYKLGDEIISFKLIKREPAKMSRDGKSMPQRGTGFSYDTRSPDEPNNVIIVESRPIDHIVEFSIWSKSAALANRRALWLERLFVNNRWAFEIQGAERFFWEITGPNTFWKVEEQRIHQIPLRFFLRLRELQVVAAPRIVQFNTIVQRHAEH